MFVCQLKISNFMKAFKINPRVLFPYMSNRTVQPVIFNLVSAEDMQENDMLRSIPIANN